MADIDRLNSIGARPDEGRGTAYAFFKALAHERHFNHGALVGSEIGEAAAEILRNSSVERLYCVEQADTPTPPPDAEAQFPARARLVGDLWPQSDRLVRVERTKQGHRSNLDENLDFLFVALSSPAAFASFGEWLVHLRKGGLVMGPSLKDPQAQQALERYCQRWGWKLETSSNNWWFEVGKPPISYVIPAFNCAAFVREAVASIYNENFSDRDEVILVDDASTDNTLSVLKELAVRHPNVRVEHHRHNKGSAAAARNTAIDAATHQLIFTLDADNVLEARSVTPLLLHLLSTGADAAAFGEIRYFDHNTRRQTHTWVLDPEITLDTCINRPTQAPVGGGNYLFTKESWARAGRYNESLGGAHDSWAFGFNQLATGSRMVTLTGSWYYHRWAYASTYVREASARNTSLTILQAVLPHLDIFEPESVNHMFSAEHRESWWDKTAERPIRIAATPRTSDRPAVASTTHHASTVRRFATRLRNSFRLTVPQL